MTSKVTRPPTQFVNTAGIRFPNRRSNNKDDDHA